MNGWDNEAKQNKTRTQLLAQVHTQIVAILRGNNVRKRKRLWGKDCDWGNGIGEKLQQHVKRVRTKLKWMGLFSDRRWRCNCSFG